MPDAKRTNKSDCAVLMLTPSTDPELWSEDLAFFLCDSASVLGERGAGLEPSGARSHNYDRHTDTQLILVKRAYKCRRLWHAQSRESRSTHLAYYLGFYRAPRQVVSRFGVFAGVVVAQFSASYQSARSRTYEKPIDAARDALEQVMVEMAPGEEARRLIDSDLELDRRNGYILSRDERKELREGQRVVREALRPLEVKRADILAKLAELDRATRSGDPVDDLVRQCQKGEPPKKLREDAEAAVRAAHREWLGRTEETCESILEAV